MTQCYLQHQKVIEYLLRNIRSCSFQQEQNKEPWKAVSSSQWNCVRVWKKFSSLPPEEIYCSYFCQSFDTYFNKGFILDIYLSALLSHAHKQNAAKLSVLCIDSTRATESMEHLLPFYQLSPSLVYPASRGYIFAVWDSVRKVASADNRSILQSGIRVKIQFLIGWNRHSKRPAQRIYDRYSISRRLRGTAYWGQSQRIEKRHSVLRTGTAKGQLNVFTTGTSYRGQARRIRGQRGGMKTKNPITPCQRDKTWRPYRWFQSECFVKREDVCLYIFWLLFKFKTKRKI